MHVSDYAPDTIQSYQEDINSHVIRECLELSCEQINTKIQFSSFSQIFKASKISAYTVYITSTSRISMLLHETEGEA